MQTLAQALYQATLTGDVSMRTALAHASPPHDLRLLAAADDRPQAPTELRPAAPRPAVRPPAIPVAVLEPVAPVAVSVPARASTPPPRR